MAELHNKNKKNCKRRHLANAHRQEKF